MTRTSVPAATLKEIKRLKVREVVVVGPNVSSAVVSKLFTAVGGVYVTTESDRYTAARDIDWWSSYDAHAAFVSRGTDQTGALIAAAEAAAAARLLGEPILLVTPGSVPTTTLQALRYLYLERAVLGGSTTLIGAPVETVMDALVRMR